MQKKNFPASPQNSGLAHAYYVGFIEGQITRKKFLKSDKKSQKAKIKSQKSQESQKKSQKYKKILEKSWKILKKKQISGKNLKNYKNL